MKWLTLRTTEDRGAWQRVLDACTPYDYYHLPEYHALAEEMGEGTAILLVHEEDDQTLALPLLLRPIDPTLDVEGEGGWYDATSVYGYAGPIHSAGEVSEAVRARFQRALTETLRAHRVVSVFSRLHPFLPQRALLAGLGDFRMSPTIAIDLTAPIDIQRSQMRGNHRVGISKLRRTGYTCQRDADGTYFDDFCRIYRETMERVQADPRYFFSPVYFERLRQALGTRLHLFVCHKAERVVAAGLFFACHGIVQYHLSGTATEALALAPVKLIVDDVRLWAVEQGLRVLHLGGGTGGRSDDSLFHFKRGFSAQTHEFAAWRWVVFPDVYQRLCDQQARRNEWLGRQVADAEFFPAYRCPALPQGSPEPGAGSLPSMTSGGTP